MSDEVASERLRALFEDRVWSRYYVQHIKRNPNPPPGTGALDFTYQDTKTKADLVRRAPDGSYEDPAVDAMWYGFQLCAEQTVAKLAEAAGRRDLLPHRADALLDPSLEHKADQIDDPKLKRARAEIDAVCDRYDIAGFFILHNAPDSAEHWFRVDTSYSRVRIRPYGDGQALHITSNLAHDYRGDRNAQRADMLATSSMLHAFAMTAADASIPLLQFSSTLDERMGITHELRGHLPDQPNPPKGETH